MDNVKWYEKQMRIFDVIPPDEKDFVSLDLQAVSKTFAGLDFNVQHIEAIDIRGGGSDKVYFKSGGGNMPADLLGTITGENINNGMRNIVYVNVHWSSESLVELRPEWMQRTVGGSFVPSGYGVGALFCVNTAFAGWTKALITDIAAYDIDGIFLDGPFFNVEACFCDACRQKFMSIYGYEMNDSVFGSQQKYKDYLEFKRKCIAEFVKECREALKSLKPQAVIYMNSIQLNGDKYCSRNNNLTIEYQDILGAEGGFLYYNLREEPVLKPGMTAKLIETQANGKPTVVFIAGRWSPWTRTLLPTAESWIIHAEVVANGAGTWYGIHVENRDDAAMKGIREINAFIQKNEKYLENSHSLAKTAILWSGKTANFYQAAAVKTDFTAESTNCSDMLKSDMLADFDGWYQMLSKNHNVFDIIDDYALENRDISRYATIILPNVSCMSDTEADKIKEFVRAGGNIISTYDTGLFDEWGNTLEEPRLKEAAGIASVHGRENMPNDHIKLEDNRFTKGISQSFMAAPNLYLKVEPAEDAEVFMLFREKQPSVYYDVMPETSNPFMVLNRYGKGYSLYFAGNIGYGYSKYQLPEYKKIAGNVFRVLNAPQIEFMEQLDSVDISYRSCSYGNVLHVINYTGAMTRPIEKVITLKNVKVRIYDTGIEKIYDTKRANYLTVTRLEDCIEAELPELNEYEIYVLTCS